jgi:hypothetical protein
MTPFAPNYWHSPSLFGGHVMDKREKRPAPRDTQIKRIRWKYGILDQYARVIAELHYGGVKQ